jgi:hypothetical protein
MTHIISKTTVSAKVTTGRYIATVDTSGVNDWQPYDGEKPVLHPYDIGYRLCNRTDVTVNGVTYKGEPESEEKFTIGEIVPIDQVSEDVSVNIRIYKENNVEQLLHHGERNYSAYSEEQFGTTIQESAVTRHDPYADK